MRRNAAKLRTGGHDRVKTGSCVHAVGTRGGAFLFPSVLESGAKGNVVLMPAQMTSNVQIHLRGAGMEDKRYILHSFRVGAAASHDMDGTTMDVLMEYSEWTSSAAISRYVG